jgi:hypothetical protein
MNTKSEEFPRIGKLEVFDNSKAWCSFEKVLNSPPDDERMMFQAAPMRHFKPLGLMLFGVSRGMTVQCLISNRDNMDVACYGTLPAVIFARAYTYEQLYKMLSEGEANLNEWADFDTVNVGNIIRIYITAPRPGMLHEVQCAMWGMSHRL